jgi:lipoate-protein ligase B
VDGENPSHFTRAEDAAVPAKIGAIGVRISRWVTMHGFALNLAPDLSLYQSIIPCGIREHGVSSVAALGREAPTPEALAPRALSVLAEVIGADSHMLSAAEFLRAPAEVSPIDEAPSL